MGEGEGVAAVGFKEKVPRSNLPKRIRTRVNQSESKSSSRKLFSFKGNNGVKNKIKWWGPSRSWLLTFKNNDPNSLKDYLERNKMTLRVPDGLTKDAFEKARHEAFLNAVKAWNDLDESRRPRIKVPRQVEPETITFPPQPGVAKPPDRDSDSDGDNSSLIDYF